MSERTGPGGPPHERQRVRSLGAEGGSNLSDERSREEQVDQ
jgi:hypothetical protein